MKDASSGETKGAKKQMNLARNQTQTVSPVARIAIASTTFRMNFGYPSCTTPSGHHWKKTA
ncbi:hypothetical protein PG988_016253 [Apiospora saccharicola]